MKNSSYLIIIILFLTSLGKSNIKGQDNDSSDFKLELNVKPEAEKKFNQRVESSYVLIKGSKALQNAKLTEKQLKSIAKKHVIQAYTLKDFFESLDSISQKRYKEFFNNANPLHAKFGEFYKIYKDSSTRSIKSYYTSHLNYENKIIKKSTDNKAMMPLVDSQRIFLETTLQTPDSKPYHNGIEGSKLYVKHFYDGQQRDIITTVDQSIFFRGRYYNSMEPYYPDYIKAHDDYCGPAAGQSILEWFNVPVKDKNGNPLQTTEGIQEQLAEEMETEDGSDYTNFYDLVDVLIKPKYIGNKGYCSMVNEASVEDIIYMLSQGTPVIALTAWDWKAHFITIYGYDRTHNNFKIANSKDMSYSKLRERLNWDEAYGLSETAMNIVGNFSNSIFSYCPTSCDREYNYKVNHSLKDWQLLAWPYLYFTDFIKQYGQNEKNIPLNLHGDLKKETHYITKRKPRREQVRIDIIYTHVNSAGGLINLSTGNSNIISNPSYYSENIVKDNSVNYPLNIQCKVDKRFLDTQDEVVCSWLLKANNGLVIEQQDVNKVNTPSDGKNYIFTYNKPYALNFSALEFSIHEGWRKVSWKLEPCSNDIDGDMICDNVDDDMDGDGIKNTSDNCPKAPNPDQLDRDKNGIGYECDEVERCLTGCGFVFDNETITMNPCLLWCSDYLHKYDLMVKPDFYWWIGELMPVEIVNELINPQKVHFPFWRFTYLNKLNTSLKDTFTQYDINMTRKERKMLIKKAIELKR
jgi:hypothetical protein